MIRARSFVVEPDKMIYDMRTLSARPLNSDSRLMAFRGSELQELLCKVFWRLLQHLLLQCGFVPSSQPSTSFRLDADPVILVMLDGADGLDHCMNIWVQ